jgi:hypothetical protein
MMASVTAIVDRVRQGRPKRMTDAARVQKDAAAGRRNDATTTAGLRRRFRLPCLSKSRFNRKTKVSERWSRR